jgi:Undecaprenyl-phosphate glucose phosphotransferase
MSTMNVLGSLVPASSQYSTESRARVPSSLSKRRFSISSHVIPGLVTGLDSLVILSSALISYLLIVADYVEDPSFYAAAVAFVWLATIMLMNLGGLYQFEPIMRPLAFADKIIIAFATTFLFLLAAAFSLKISTEYSRLWIGSFALSACFTTVLLRLCASIVVGRLADKRVFSRNVIIVGAHEQAEKLLGHLAKAQPRFVSVLGLFTDGSRDAAGSVSRFPVLGTLDGLTSYIRTNQVDDVIISMPWSADERIAEMVNLLRELPVNVYLGADLIGFRLPFRPPPDHFGETPLVEVMGRPLAGWGIVQKVTLDYGLGTILTLLLLPVMLLIAIAIKLESKGSALFRQPRYGFSNKVFSICKFRTMKACDPEKITVQATRNDPRVTRVGRFLRRMSLDELPQLFNVLNGTMSLVGPRPHAVDHNEAYAQMIRGYFARHRVKPGLTGWAQVNGYRGEIKNLEDMQARVKHDIYYAENWSLLFDLKILVKTVIIVLTGRNAY